MPAFDDIRVALAANLRAIKGCQVSAYLLDNPTGPALQVAGLEELDFDTTFNRGGDNWVWVVEGLVPWTSDKGAQKAFAPWLNTTGTSSVKTVLEADKHLTQRLQDNGNVLTGQTALADYVRVTNFRNLGRTRLTNAEAYLGEWRVIVHTSN